MRVAITDFSGIFPVANGCVQLAPRSSLRDLEIGPEIGFDAAFEITEKRREAIEIEPQRLAIVSGSSKGDLHALTRWSEDQNLVWTPDFPLSMARAGVFLSPNAACATGAHALALGAQQIRNGRADVAWCQVVEFPQHPMILAAYRNMGALSKSGVMRPFDARRDGFMPRWGIGSLRLEAEDFARERGAEIHGFLSGASLRCDAHHMTSMDASGAGIARAIEDALENAGRPTINYINAHGTATRNDAVESRAIHAVFGDGVPVSSTKAQTGHLLGAAGAVEAIICLLAMQQDFAPPTLNLEQPDGEFGLDYLPLVGREMAIGASLSLSYGFGGHIGALVLEKAA